MRATRSPGSIRGLLLSTRIKPLSGARICSCTAPNKSTTQPSSSPTAYVDNAACYGLRKQPLQSNARHLLAGSVACGYSNMCTIQNDVPEEITSPQCDRGLHSPLDFDATEPLPSPNGKGTCADPRHNYTSSRAHLLASVIPFSRLNEYQLLGKNN